MSFILKSGENLRSFEAHGGERARLIAEAQTNAATLGVKVPEWFCVSSTAMERFLKGNAIDGFLATLPTIDQRDDSLRAFAAEVEKRFLGSSVSPEVTRAIEVEMKSLGISNSPVTISASWLQNHSVTEPHFPRQKTVIDILIALRKAWASAYSFESLSARKSAGLPLWPSFAGVVIQKSLRSHSIGYARLSEAPGDENETEIHAKWGDGHGTEEEIQLIHDLAEKCPYGFEWAMEGEQLYLLQAYPRTLALVARAG